MSSEDSHTKLSGPEGDEPDPPTTAYRDPKDPNDIRNVLTDEHIARLRTGYDAERMNQAATRALAAPYPPAKELVGFIIKHFYSSKRWAPDRREQCVITYFASRSAGNGANLGIHIYWGLMEGLSPDVIADTILLAAAYSGIENYGNGIGVMRFVLTTLKALAESGEPGAVDCMNVAQKLRPASP